MGDLSNQESSRLELTNRVKRFALDNGAHLVGVAPVERFEGAPRGHHPTDFLPDCKSVIVIASRILDRGLEHPRLLPNGSEFIPDEHLRDVMQDYFFEIQSHGPTSELLSMLGLRVAMLLQDEGHGSIYFPATMSDIYGQQRLKGRIREFTFIFSHRHAAVRAGLGEFGLNNIVVTPEYGQRVRFVSVATSAELEPTPLLTKKACLGKKCARCLTHCEREGVLKLLPEAETNQVWINMVGVTNRALCNETIHKNHCKGQCVSSCPVGRRARPPRTKPSA